MIAFYIISCSAIVVLLCLWFYQLGRVAYESKAKKEEQIAYDYFKRIFDQEVANEANRLVSKYINNCANSSDDN